MQAPLSGFKSALFAMLPGASKKQARRLVPKGLRPINPNPKDADPTREILTEAV